MPKKINHPYTLPSNNKNIEPVASERPENHNAQMNSISRSILENEIIEAIKQVYDPEIPLNIYDLGLIYEIHINDNAEVHVVMTLTSPHCPVAEILPQQVEDAVRSVSNVKDVKVELTWDPPFSMDMLSDEAKLALGLL